MKLAASPLIFQEQHGRQLLRFRPPPYTELVTLESITMTSREVSGGGTGKDGVYYVVITDESLNILGWSDAAPTTAGTFTWKFENSPLTLDTSETYFAIAYGDVSTLEKDTTLTAESTAENMQFGSNGLWKYPAAGHLDFTDTENGQTGLLFLNAGGYALNTNQTQHAPYVTIVTKSIPEPATATLSLLALCGLAARRRRK